MYFGNAIYLNLSFVGTAAKRFAYLASNITSKFTGVWNEKFCGSYVTNTEAKCTAIPATDDDIDVFWEMVDVVLRYDCYKSDRIRDEDEVISIFIFEQTVLNFRTFYIIFIFSTVEDGTSQQQASPFGSGFPLS